MGLNRAETPREKYASAFKRKTELPIPANILESPSGTLSDRYQEARIAVDRFWATFANEILVKHPAAPTGPRSGPRIRE